MPLNAARPARKSMLTWKSFVFGCLESVSNWRAARRAPQAAPYLPAIPASAVRTAIPRVIDTASARPPSLWVFVSTIGELNAVEPFVQLVLSEMGQPPLTLLSDRTHYQSAYLAKFPHAHVETLTGTAAEIHSLITRHPPLMLVVAEIPCKLHDAPCRFSYRTLLAARHAQAPVVLVNGWLYGYQPPSRLDAIESWLFADAYLDAFDLMMVQTTEVRDHLVAAGAHEAKVVVTGNIKFDGMRPAFALPNHAPLRDALRARHGGPVVVAGSLTRVDQQQAVIDGYAQLASKRPDALLILAPRHPENPSVMAELARMLNATGLAWRLRSANSPSEAVAVSVMVLDTMGELRSCYAECTMAYVGTDHSVLEPLAFGKPVFVSDGWEPTFPSYPVYRQLLEAGALQAVGPVQALGDAWWRHLSEGGETKAQALGIEHILSKVQGAAERSLQAMRTHGVFKPLN
jgi:3-deoxy-D-manno-octulosonic-acid transferase